MRQNKRTMTIGEATDYCQVAYNMGCVDTLEALIVEINEKTNQTSWYSKGSILAIVRRFRESLISNLKK